jgi:hypothetical protein
LCIPVLSASFLASSVECVDALTIVLTVGSVRGWRPALFGTGLAAALDGARRRFWCGAQAAAPRFAAIALFAGFNLTLCENALRAARSD